MMYLLDTNIVIFCIRHPNSLCAETLAKHIGKDVCISVVTYAELVYGIENSAKPEQNRSAIVMFLSGIRIIDFDMKAAEEFGLLLAELKKARLYSPGQDRDKMIAAHARSRGDILVTDNISDFASIPRLDIVNWRTPGDLSF